MKINKKGFTLAETLITLAIIGIVAALSIPTLMSKYQKHVTAKKVAKFYSTMHNTIGLINAEQGNTGWLNEAIDDKNRNSIKFYDKYLKDKFKSVKKIDYHNNPYTTFSDGSAFITWFGGLGEKTIFFTYCTTIEHCKKDRNEGYDGKNGFLFVYDKTRGFVPYCDTYRSRENLLASCKIKSNDRNKSHCCSALLMKDNWEIKDDYPWNW